VVSRVQRFRVRSSRQNENQSRYSNLLNNYMEKSLIYGVRKHSIHQEYWECRKCKGQANRSVKENTGKQGKERNKR